MFELLAAIDISAKEKPGTVTIAGHPSGDVPAGTLNAILKQAGLK